MGLTRLTIRSRHLLSVPIRSEHGSESVAMAVQVRNRIAFIKQTRNSIMFGQNQLEFRKYIKPAVREAWSNRMG